LISMAALVVANGAPTINAQRNYLSQWVARI